MQALTLALAVLFYVTSILLMSRAAGRIDPLLGVGVSNAFGAALPLALYFLVKLRGASGGFLGESVPLAPGGLQFSVLSGIAIAIFGFFLMKSFAGGPVSYVIPMIYGATVAVSALVGWTLFRETFNPLEAFGVAVVLCGLALIVFARLRSLS